MKENIEQQKRAMHDTRQMLRNVGPLAKAGKQAELLKYIAEDMDYTTVSDKRFCPNASSTVCSITTPDSLRPGILTFRRGPSVTGSLFPTPI